MPLLRQLGQAYRHLRDGCRLMVGMPSYETYLDHMRRHHPEEPPLTYAEFFRNRQDAHYGASGRGGSRCC